MIAAKPFALYCQRPAVQHGFRGPEDRTNIRILQTMSAGIPLALGLGSRMLDPNFLDPLAESGLLSLHPCFADGF